MSITIYGATLWSVPKNEDNFDSGAIGKNSEVFTTGDVITLDGTNGCLVMTDGGPALGVVAKTATMTSSNQTVAKVKPSYIPACEGYKFLMGTNSDLSALTSIGVYYEVSGTTGIQQVDVSEGAVAPSAGGTVMITAVDPMGLGGSGAGSGLRTCLVKFAEVFPSQTT